MSNINNGIIMYGSDWCGFTQRAKREMETMGVAYTYVDVDKEPQAEQLIASWNEGRAIRPTFDIGGEHLVNPATATLEAKLREIGALK
jgi:glutaredoxin